MRNAILLGLPTGASELQIIGSPGDPTERNVAFKKLVASRGDDGKYELIELWTSTSGRSKRKVFKHAAEVKQEEQNPETDPSEEAASLEPETLLPADGPTLGEEPVAPRGRKK